MTTKQRPDVWDSLLTSIDRIRLAARPQPAGKSYEKLVIDPRERPRVEKNDVTGRWHVIYRRTVGNRHVPDVESFERWPQALLAAEFDVANRLANWVATHDGLTDYEDQPRDFTPDDWPYEED